MTSMSRSIFLVAICALPMCAQRAVEMDGNIIFEPTDGSKAALTSSGLDSQPSLSADGRQVVFVRSTPNLTIDTGLGDQEENELWIADTTGAVAPRRVLRGHPGGFRVDANLVLGGFWAPQFSPDAKRIYFMSTIWATSHGIWLLDVAAGQVRFLCDGLDLEVLNSGPYAGNIIVRKHIPRVVPGRVFRYWLLDRDGNEVGEIGEAESALEEFFERAGVRKQ